MSLTSTLPASSAADNTHRPYTAAETRQRVFAIMAAS